MKLVRHPPPHPTESLPGYVLRLCEANGYESPNAIFRVARMKGTEASWTNLDCTKLAAAANCSVTDLERLAFRRKEDDLNIKYMLGKTITAENLNLTAAKVCPECVAEKGFIEAHWHIDLMVGCPIHLRPAVWYCPGCRSRIPWLRKGLLICKCGRRLENRDRESFSEAELWLLELMRCKAVGGSISRPNEVSLPAAQLSAMSLMNLLSFVRFLGRTRRNASWSSKNHYAKHLLSAAAGVFTDWPRNIHVLLRDICPSTTRPMIAESYDGPGLYPAVCQAINEAYDRRRAKSLAACSALPEVGAS